MAVVHFHLMACCVAIGLVLISDIDMVRQLIEGVPGKRLDPEHLASFGWAGIAIDGLPAKYRCPC